ncbi:hypothetical protein BDF20DRAFT_989361 [Mycotypha africana]|uniref:uncharacterized protein n=1 Tax=Mycotypha africana TaxID=64632 RepID=UPI0022FFEA96|nr:uncharacterized protein BDF20DRAFT_989361 [Mycotypha africana]KAI8973370.1 hypothetical protein BDF20DRAFT_989361 [Mycotypha africana]
MSMTLRASGPPDSFSGSIFDAADRGFTSNFINIACLSINIFSDFYLFFLDPTVYSCINKTSLYYLVVISVQSWVNTIPTQYLNFELRDRRFYYRNNICAKKKLPMYFRLYSNFLQLLKKYSSLEKSPFGVMYTPANIKVGTFSAEGLSVNEVEHANHKVLRFTETNRVTDTWQK